MIDEGQQLNACIDERDPHAERGEDARVLQPDHSGSDNRQRARQLLDTQQVIAGEDVLAVARRKRVVHGRRAHRDHDDRGAGFLNESVRHELKPDAMRIRERGVSGENVDVVAHQLVPGDVDLVADDMVHPKEQIAHRDVLLDGIRRTVDSALAVAGQTKRGFPERLAGDGAGVDADSANDRPLLDDGHPLVELGALKGGTMAGRTRADDEQVVVILGHPGHGHPPRASTIEAPRNKSATFLKLS
jgi:hypothetical protein